VQNSTLHDLLLCFPCICIINNIPNEISSLIISLFPNTFVAYQPATISGEIKIVKKYWRLDLAVNW